MDVTAALGPMVAPGAEPEVADGRDPATAAAFTALLAGLVAPPALRGAATTAPIDGGPAAGGAPAGTSVAGPAPRLGLATVIDPSEARAVEPGRANGVPGPAESTHPTTPALPAAPAVRATPAVPATPGEPATRAEPATDRTGGAVPDDPTATTATTTAQGGPHRLIPALPDVAVGLSHLARGARHGERPAFSAADGVAPLDTATHAPSADALGPLAPPTHPDTEDERPTDGSPDAAAVAGLEATPASDGGPRAVATADVGAFPGSRGIERALAAQLVERVGTLRHREDGDYELTIQLEPADLGRVELRVRLEGGVVHVQVGAESPATTELVRRSLPDLREALVQAGLDAGTLDVGSRAGQGQHDTDPRHDHDLRGAEPPAPLPAQVRSASPVHPSTRAGLRTGVDVLL